MPAFRRSSSASSSAARIEPAGPAARGSAGGIGHLELHQRHRGEAQDAGEREQAVHADAAIKQRRGDQRQRKHEADHRADHGHDLGAMLLAREIGGERHRHRRDRPGSLQHARRDHGPDVVRQRSRGSCRRRR